MRPNTALHAALDEVLELTERKRDSLKGLRNTHLPRGLWARWTPSDIVCRLVMVVLPIVTVWGLVEDWRFSGALTLDSVTYWAGCGGIAALCLYAAWQRLAFYPPARSPEQLLENWFTALRLGHFDVALAMTIPADRDATPRWYCGSIYENWLDVYPNPLLNARDYKQYMALLIETGRKMRLERVSVEELEPGLTVVEFGITSVSIKSAAFLLKTLGVPTARSPQAPFRKLAVLANGEWLLWSAELQGLDEAFLGWHPNGGRFIEYDKEYWETYEP